MKNRLTDVHNHLMMQLEKLNEVDLTGEDLEDAIKRADASVRLVKQIHEGGRLALDAMKMQNEYAMYSSDGQTGKLPAMLQSRD